MRIAISTGTRRLAGGVETYLSALIPALVARGHELALVYERDDPADRLPIHHIRTVPEWPLLPDPGPALAALSAWAPDVIFAQGLDDPQLEVRVSGVAPTVLFAHAYRGTCVSGTKTFAMPDYQACTRELGWPCLAHYLPRQCGGLSPATMMTLYSRETTRRERFGQYRGIVAFSQHIASEYARHGVDAALIHRVPAHATPPPGIRAKALPADGPIRLAFVGRMEAEKGGDRLLDALPRIQAALRRPVHLTLAGDGRLRGPWQARAMQLDRQNETTIEFVGWLTSVERDQLFAEAHLLVVPSLWPEPFGLVGLEAAGQGLPAAAFALGGITEWLTDGVNGALAAASPPRPDALADAVVRCLSNAERFAELSAGALRVAAEHSMDAHLRAVLAVLAAAAGPRVDRSERLERLRA